MACCHTHTNTSQKWEHIEILNLVFILNGNATHMSGDGGSSVTVSTLLAVCLSFYSFISFRFICECAQQWLVVLLSLLWTHYSVSLHHSRFFLYYLFQPLNGIIRFTVDVCTHDILSWCLTFSLSLSVPACLPTCVCRIRLLETSWNERLKNHSTVHNDDLVWIVVVWAPHTKKSFYRGVDNDTHDEYFDPLCNSRVIFIVFFFLFLFFFSRRSRAFSAVCIYFLFTLSEVIRNRFVSNITMLFLGARWRSNCMHRRNFRLKTESFRFHFQNSFFGLSRRMPCVSTTKLLCCHWRCHYISNKCRE